MIINKPKLINLFLPIIIQAFSVFGFFIIPFSAKARVADDFENDRKLGVMAKDEGKISDIISLLDWRVMGVNDERGRLFDDEGEAVDNKTTVINMMVNNPPFSEKANKILAWLKSQGASLETINYVCGPSAHLGTIEVGLKEYR